MIMLPSQRREAMAHVEALTGDVDTPCTFQLFADVPCMGWPKILHGRLRDLGGELIQANSAGCGVFITVNATDLQGRKASNINRVRALFIDCDGFTPDDWHLEPSFVVRSAAGPHAYWLVDYCDPAAFADCQRRLAMRYQSDPRMTDLPRVLRLAGFYHRKASPVAVTLDPARGPRYHVTDVLAGLPALPVAPARTWTPGTGTGGGWRAIDAVGAFRDAGLLGRLIEPGKWAVYCPWGAGHSNADGPEPDSSTVLWETSADGASVFHCSHASCQGRYLSAALREVGSW